MRKRVCFSGAGRLTALLLAVVMAAGLISVPASAAVTAHFTDVSSGHWAFRYVERAYADGAVVGTGGDPAAGRGTFSPDGQMTYGEFLTMLVNAFYREELGRVSKDGPWYAPAIRVAVSRGLTYLDQDQLMELAPYSIDRCNAAWILVRILDDKCVVLPTDRERAAAAAKIGDWSDLREGEYWAYFVSSIYALGIISGVDSSGTFDGDGRITRASATVIYTRMADKLKTSGNDPGAFQVTFDGDWSSAPEGYREALEEEFYIVYPRLWARWGNAEVDKHVSVQMAPGAEIDNNAAVTCYEFDLPRYRFSLTIKMSIEDANERPNNRAVFAHELTHAATNGVVTKIESDWLIECLADYGLFRYAAWADEQYRSAECYYRPEEAALRDWYYEAYGDSQWFFAWMDEKYPTTETGRGLLDSILLGIRSGQIGSDGGADQDDPDLDALIRDMTGYGGLEALRRQYIRELDAGTWAFNGFAGYADNCITEDLPQVPDPTYPSPEGFDLCSGAYTYDVSGQASKALEANNLVDGDLSTRWEAAGTDVEDRKDLNWDTQHKLTISLGRPVSFNTYTLYHAGSQGNSGENTRAWRLWYYDSGTESWEKLDEVRGNTRDVTTRSFAPVTSQYLWLEVLQSSGTGDGAVRLYELELYDKR